MVRAFGEYCIAAQFVLGPDTVQGHLRDAPAIAVPVCQFRIVGMSAQADDLPTGKELAEVPPCERICLTSTTVEEPAAVFAVVRQQRPVNQNEGMPGALSF